MSIPSLSDFDLYLFHEGNHDRVFEKLGAHTVADGDTRGTHFAAWAPNAVAVSAIGEFNGWDPGAHPMQPLGYSGVWEAFVPGAGSGALYKYSIAPAGGGPRIDKADPYAFASEAPPGTASRIWDLSGYEWGDADWLSRRADRQSEGAPIAIYEVHLGSWRRVPEEGGRSLNYRELAPMLADYAGEMGFTHIELMPVTEHPFEGSWGYQTVGYFAPTARYGTPQDLMYLIDTLHRQNIGVILDWVPAHFPRDPHGLVEFDGTRLYEYADPKKGLNKKWNTLNFDYQRSQVVNFLIGSALHWLGAYHIDGLRVDAIESLVRLDFGREPGEWEPNVLGGPENLEAMEFLRRLNRRVHANHPGVLTIAEDPTTTPDVTRSVEDGGLGFDLKWDLGWVHDTLDSYMTLEPSRRKDAHGKLTFRMHYAFDEKYVLPLGHDEVVLGKHSLLGKMPGDDWQKRANLRLLLGYMLALPGKKLIFMGGEFGQWGEWDHDASLDWHLLDDPRHQGLRRWVRDLNTTYRGTPPLHQWDFRPEGFAWADCRDAEQSVLSFIRRGEAPGDVVLAVCNFTPTSRKNYRVGVPFAGHYDEILNSDARLYGGSGQGNLGGLDSAPVRWHGQPQSLNLALPPLGMLALRSRM